MNRQQWLTGRLARVAFSAALFAILSVSALQISEINHQHVQADAAEHCLSCKAEGGIALTGDFEQGHSYTTSSRKLSIHYSVNTPIFFQPGKPRGPPSFS